MSKYTVHQSWIRCWRTCKRKFWYQYILRLIKRRPSLAPLRGTVIHRIIEEKANGRNPWIPLKELEKEHGKLFASEREMYGDPVSDIRIILEGYFAWYEKDPLTPRSLVKGGQKAEHKFQIDLTPSIILEGKVDEFAEDTQHKTWLVDHKSVKSMPKGNLRYSDIQSSLYYKAYKHLIKIQGMCWNYILFKTPTIPEILKNGQLSRAQNIKTTWTIYKQAVIDNGLKVKDYLDMKEILEGKEADFFRRDYMPLNDTIVDNLWEEAQITAREMKRKAGRDRTRTIDRHCDYCDYYNLCQAELRGLDADFIRKNDYKEKENENPVVGNEEDE